MHFTDMKINYAASGTHSTFYDGTPTHMSSCCISKNSIQCIREDYDDLLGGVGY